MFSVCIPTYNCADTIKDTIQDVLNQTYQDFEIIVSDDNSKDNIEEVVSSFNDPRIKFYKNEGKQLGCGGNEEKCRQLAKGEFIMLLPGKARISRIILQRYHKVFQDPEVGAITRLYYWFGKDLNHVVRAKIKHTIPDEIAILETLDTSGGLAFRREWLTPFNSTPFVEFTYPFLEIWKNHSVILVNEYLMAHPAFKHSHSQDSYVYKQSPMKNWIDMFETVYSKAPDYCKHLIEDFVAVNYIGLVQVRNYGTYRQYLREVWYLVKYRPMNLLNIKLWFWVALTILTPRKVLKCLVRKVKENTRLNVRLANTT